MFTISQNTKKINFYLSLFKYRMVSCYDKSDSTKINNYQVQCIIIVIYKAQYNSSSVMNCLPNDGSNKIYQLVDTFKFIE